jgi:predicted enzyme related to lactoylglutathione lyase
MSSVQPTRLVPPAIVEEHPAKTTGGIAMPRTTPPPGAPCWFELASTDPGVSATFHHALFGWSQVDMDLGPMGTYSFLRNGNGTVGALCSLPPGAPPHSSWNVYFGVTDADGATRRAQDLGAQVVAEPFDVAEHGRMSMLMDPTGAPFCLWQSRNPDAGDFVMFEDHAIGWVELASRDAVAARDFYVALLGWECESSKVSMPGGIQYTEYGVGGVRYGGILPMTAEWGEMSSHWSIYVMVPDADACTARATELGGKVSVPAFDAPGVGRIARIDDPTGAGLYVIRLLRS